MKSLATVLLAAVLFCSCSDDACISHTGRVCTEGNVYWLDSCGNFQELIEECRCGCKTAAPECKHCDDCTCSDENTCCDGCLPQNDGDFCDDGDAGTRLDMCQDGACAGWDFTIAEPALPAEPAAPEPVQLQSWVCPTGWIAVEHPTLGFSWCRPPPPPRLRSGVYTTPLEEGEQDGDRPVCEPEVDGTFPVLGHADCRPLGDPCPAGDWPEIPPEITGTRIYVMAGAVNGDGTQAAPFATVGEAVDAAMHGDVVVIGAGTYPEALAITKNLTLWGKCVQQTAIEAPAPGIWGNLGAVMIGQAVPVTLRNLRLGGQQVGVRLDQLNAEVTLQGVWIHSATKRGIVIEQGTADLNGVLIDSTNPDENDEHGEGLVLGWGAQVQVESSTIEHNWTSGVLVTNPDTRIDMQDVMVRNTDRTLADGDRGHGLEVTFGAQAEVIRGLFDEPQMSVYAASTNTTLRLEDVVVEDTMSDAWGEHGSGLWIHGGAQATVVRGLLERNRWSAVLVDSPESELHLEDIVVRDTRCGLAEGIMGRGVVAQGGTTLDLSRGLVEDSRAVGVLVVDPDTLATLQDVVIRWTFPACADDTAGRGLVSYWGAGLILRRGLIEENREIGIAVAGDGSTADLQDVIVRSTLYETSSQLYGQGLLVFTRGQASVTRGLFEGNRTTGIEAAGENVRLQLTDVTTRRNKSRRSDRRLGFGLHAYEGAQVDWVRGLAEENADGGIVANQPGTSVHLSDITIRDTLSAEGPRTGGEGLVVLDQASVSLARGWLEGNRNAGIVCQDAGSQCTLEDVTVLDTLSQYSDGMKGYGLVTADGAALTLQRGRLEGNHGSGLAAGGAGAFLSAHDITVRDTRSREADLYMGRGLEVNKGAEAEIVGGRFEQNRDVGVAAFSPDTRLTLTRVVIQDTLERECASGAGPFPCEGFGHGSGLGIFQQATVFLEGVEIEASQLAGLQLAEQGTASGLGVSLRNNPIGVNIQSTPAGYDFFDQVKGLLMEDNQTNFDTTNLPIPDPLEMGP